MSTADILTYKKRVFSSLIDRKKREFQELAAFQEKQLDSINESKDNESHDMIESPIEQEMREVRVENKTIDRLREEVNYLDGFDSFRARETVEVGTVVKTNQGNFIVAVPETTFTVGEETYQGISSKSPLFQEMQGKKAGDEMKFNGQEYKIELVV